MTKKSDTDSHYVTLSPNGRCCYRHGCIGSRLLACSRSLRASRAAARQWVRHDHIVMACFAVVNTPIPNHQPQHLLDQCLIVDHPCGFGCVRSQYRTVQQFSRIRLKLSVAEARQIIARHHRSLFLENNNQNTPTEEDQQHLDSLTESLMDKLFPS